MKRDTVDLTLDSDEEAESPTAAAAREEAQRKRIMDFARAKRARTGDTASMNPAASPVPTQPRLQQQQQQVVASASASAGAAQHAGQDAAHAASTQVAAAGAAPAQAAADASTVGADSGSRSGGFSNSDLKALHEARLQRQRAQQGSATAASTAAAAAEAGGGGASAGAGQQGGSDKGKSSSTAGRSGSAARAQMGAAAAAAGATAAAGTSSSAAAGSDACLNSKRPLSLLTYNVWFREDIAVVERMQGIADIISQSGYPTFIALQEVTPLILDIFQQMPWWQRYECSPPPKNQAYFTLLLVNRTAVSKVTRSNFEEVHFDNSGMGRSLKVVTVSVGSSKVLVATSHLESPVPPQAWYSRERKQQMAFSLKQLDSAPYGNVLFAGDMNWTDSRDGSPPLPSGWSDAWQQLHPGEPGFTYDSRNNPMLAHKQQGLRLDRIFARLKDFRLESVSIVGREQLAGVTHTHVYKSSGAKRELPVLPSDHFGLLLQLIEV